MSKSIKALVALAVVATAAACSNNNDTEEFVVVDPAPISSEPTYTGKYK